MHLSMVSPTPKYGEGGDIVGTSDQFPHHKAEIGDQIPYPSPHSEVRKIGDLTLYIAYENTWKLVQIKCPTLETKFCIKSPGNAPLTSVLVGVGHNMIGALHNAILNSVCAIL